MNLLVREMSILLQSSIQDLKLTRFHVHKAVRALLSALISIVVLASIILLAVATAMPLAICVMVRQKLTAIVVPMDIIIYQVLVFHVQLDVELVLQLHRMHVLHVLEPHASYRTIHVGLVLQGQHM